MATNKAIAVIGAGLTGSIIARHAAEAGWQVDIYEKRSHIGGNCFDYEDLGSYTHQYGPHLFHTSDSRTAQYLQLFADFIPYQHKVHALIDGGMVPIPYSLKSLSLTHPPSLAERISEKLIESYGYGSQVTIYSLLSSDDSDLKSLGQYIYDKIFHGYSCKQWGTDSPLELDKNVLNRIPVRISNDSSYFLDRYQFLPKYGYTSLIQNILDHPLISVECGHPITLNHGHFTNARSHATINDQKYRHIFFSGMIDSLFDFKHGPLPYRSLSFTLSQAAIDLSKRPSMQTNFPCNYDFTRISDYSFISKALGRSPETARIATEYPGTYDPSSVQFQDPFYPLFTKEARMHYEKYANELASISSLITACGRLGHYKYYDMDDAIIAAFGIVEKSTFLRQ